MKKIVLNNKNFSLISPLQWDSSFFHLQIGKIEVESLSTDHVNVIWNCLDDSVYDLVYLFANFIDEAARLVLEGKDIHPVDIKVTYHKQISETVLSDNNFIEQYNGNVTARLLQLAYDSGHKSRFRKDTNLNHRFKEMYKLWIEKSVNGELANAVLIANLNGKFGGFITIKKDGENGTIGLISVDEALRGKGIGTALLNEAENWCSKMKCRKLFVATQSENEQACRLYEKKGFSEYSTQYIYHLYRDHVRV